MRSVGLRQMDMREVATVSKQEAVSRKQWVSDSRDFIRRGGLQIVARVLTP